MELTKIRVSFNDKKCGWIHCQCVKLGARKWDIDFRSELNYRGVAYTFSRLRIVSPTSLKFIIKKSNDGEIYKELLKES